MFLENYTKFIQNYGKGRYHKMACQFVLSFFAGVLEFVGIALIYPFILMIVNPNMLTSSHIYAKYLACTHITNNTISALLMGVLVLLIFIFKNLFIIFTQFVQNKFVADWKRDLTQKFMEYYIYAPYKNIMKIAQAKKIYVINTLCTQAIDGFVMRGLNFVTNVIIITMVVFLLMLKFPIAAIVTMIFVTISMIIQNKFFKKRMSKISQNIAKEFQVCNEAVMENINNLKEIKILSVENFFYENYAEKEKSFRKIQGQQMYYSSIPPYIVEILIVVSLLLLAGIISLQYLSDQASLIASFAIVVAALFRIAPALNRIQTSIIYINASRNFVKKLNDEYINYGFENFKAIKSVTTEKINFGNKIELKNINFAYTDDKQVIKDFSLTITKGDFIGIIGLSGAGKSTFADILTGLLPPQSGNITVDDIILTPQNYPTFRRIIGYVPQQINVMDKSFKENVAWGMSTDEINEETVIKSLKDAQLYDFILGYKEGINTTAIAGSNGLSQGQKQRLAIARALYRTPEILIFDEATSSLDVQVENEITEMLKNLSKTKTIIAIAHRLSTLKACNKLVYLKDGHIVDIGSFSELSRKHLEFNNLLKLSSLS